MKISSITQSNKAWTMGLLVLTTIATTIGSTLVITPTVSAEGFDLFQQVRSLFDNKSSSKNGGNSLQAIIARGDAEITRRLAELTKLANLVNGATHLSTTDKTMLTNEINAEISSLTALKTKLDSDTTIAAARADARDIVTEYRVYAFVAPKIHLIKHADDIQATNARLEDLAAKLQTRIAAEKAAGKDVSGLDSKLMDLNAQVATSQNIAGNIEAKVISLQPSDYNSDHKILAGYNAQLKTAHTDDQAAYADARFIIEALKKL